MKELREQPNSDVSDGLAYFVDVRWLTLVSKDRNRPMMAPLPG
jgi:hypothetical protein